jgi:hypothetical protein
LNDSCTIEVHASRQGSAVQNVLKLALDKIKANENPSEYCLVEHIEQEKTILKQDSINSISQKRSTQYPASSMQKKLSVVKTTRILEPNENLFLLTHVWNQLKSEGKDGFKNVKIILTKTSTKPDSMLSASRLKRSSLLKHRFSLQPKPSTGFTLIETLKQTSNNLLSRQPSDLITKLPSPLLNEPTPTVISSASIKNKSFTINRYKRNKSSLNRLVRQKSFDESNEMIDQTASLSVRKPQAQFLQIINRNNFDDKMYPKQQPINNYEVVREKSEENLTSSKLNGNNTSEDDDDDIYEVYRENKTKHCSLTSSNKTDEVTDNTVEMNSASDSNKQENCKELIEYNNNNPNDEYDNIDENEVKILSKNYETEQDKYHDDYDGLQNDEYQFIGQAPLASQSMMSSNDLSDDTELTNYPINL